MRGKLQHLDAAGHTLAGVRPVRFATALRIKTLRTSLIRRTGRVDAGAAAI